MLSIRCRRRRLLAVLLGLAVLPLGASASAADAEPLSASFGSWVDARAGDGEARSSAYVDPDSYPVNLDACASTGDIVSYRWTLTIGREVVRRNSRACKLVKPAMTRPRGCTKSPDAPECLDAKPPVDPRFRVPREGSYFVTLEVVARDGSRARVNRWIKVADTFIVAVGDSMSSGEGNPDFDGRLSAEGYVPPVWGDRQCHRSSKGAPARLARAWEDRARMESVTFVNLACSGAELTAGLLSPYGGMEGGSELPSQVAQLRRLLCGGRATCPRGEMRPIEHLTISAGINDVRFSTILKLCALFGDDCDSLAWRDFSAGYNTLFESYERLAAQLRTLPIERVTIMDYPGDPFGMGGILSDREAGGCGALRGINGDEAALIARMGELLNSRIERSAARNGWSVARGATPAFRPHGYCHEDSWLRSLSDSLDMQGNVDGTMHPTGKGHAILAQFMVNAMTGPAPPQPAGSLAPDVGPVAGRAAR